MRNLMLVSAIIFTLLVSSVSVSAQYVPGNDVTIIVDGKVVTLEEKPIIINSRTLVPLRGLFEYLGAKVDWNKETKQAIVQNSDVELLLTKDNKYSLVNGKIEMFDTASQIFNDRLYVPARFIATALGADVKWDGKTRTVYITTKPYKPETTLPTFRSAEEFRQLLKINGSLERYMNMRFSTLLYGLNLEESKVGLSAEADSVADSAKEKSNTSFSKVNDQVSGVSEGDITVTNGKYIATISGDENKLVITDIRPKKPIIIYSEKLDSYIEELYITDEKVVVVSSGYEDPVEVIVDKKEISNYTEKIAMPYLTRNKTHVRVYNITPKTPRLEYHKTFDGNYNTSRLIKDNFYMITNNNFYLPIGIEYNFDSILPKIIDNLTGEITTTELTDIRYFPGFVSPSMMNTISINIDTNETETDSYIGSSDEVYVSKDNIYTTQRSYRYEATFDDEQYMPTYSEHTKIYKFAIKDGKIRYLTEGKVKGIVLNQFSMDEYKGDFRIATTENDFFWGSREPENHLFILDKDLNLKSSLTGLAKGERIYSVRYNNDRIYIVTFKQVDPLFVIDASDSYNPVVLGQLKIPGFSEYMHIIDENHILGFGQDTFLHNGNVLAGGFKISLFDVTDPKNPIEKKSEVIGKRGTFSELKYNHKALMFDLQKGIFAFPITVCSNVPYVTDFEGAYVYHVTNDDFKFKGSIKNYTGSDNTPNYDDTIRRILYVGDDLFTVSGNYLVDSDLNTLQFKSALDLNQ